jgi:hypothetical protein
MFYSLFVYNWGLTLYKTLDNLFWSLLWRGYSEPGPWIHGLWQSQHYFEDNEAGVPSSVDTSNSGICYIEDHSQGKWVGPIKVEEEYSRK